MLDRLRQILRQAADPDSPFGGCLVYGGEDFLHDYLGRGLQSLVERGRTLEKYDCGQTSFEDFLVTAAAPSFFATDKIVYLTNLSAWKRAEQEQLIAWLKGQAASSPVSQLFISGRKLVGNRFPISSLKKLLPVLKSARPRPSDTVRLLAGRLRRLEVKAASRVLEELVYQHDNNLPLVERELEKMALFVGPGGCIDHRVVELLGAGGSTNIFKFCDALGEGRTVAALEALDALLKARAEGLMILAMAARQYRLLARAARPDPRRLSAAEMARALHVQPFVVRKLRQQLRSRKEWDWAAIFTLLSRADQQFKSSGKPPPAIILENLVLRLAGSFRQAGGRPE
jgi:DNA polymerase-3 subunit delta